MLKTRSIFIPVLLVLMSIVLTACGSAYVDALNPAIDEFNSAANDLNDQLDIFYTDNDVFTDPQWVADTGTSLAIMRGAAQALNNLPNPDSNDYNRLNTLVKQLADTTITMVDIYREAIDTADIALTDEADVYIDKINELLPQINAEISRLDG